MGNKLTNKDGLGLQTLVPKCDCVGHFMKKGHDVIGIHVAMEKYHDGEIRNFIGTVKAIENVKILDIDNNVVGYQNVLVIHYFNGEPWPFSPHPSNVSVI